MRVMDVVMAIPMTMFAIVIVAALGTSTANLILALGIASVPLFARVVRSAVLTAVSYTHLDVYKRQGCRWYRPPCPVCRFPKGRGGAEHHRRMEQ